MLLNGVVEINNIASSLGGGKGENTLNNNAKWCKNYFKRGRIMLFHY